jgi:hypothetical protein
MAARQRNKQAPQLFQFALEQSGWPQRIVGFQNI